MLEQCVAPHDMDIEEVEEFPVLTKEKEISVLKIGGKPLHVFLALRETRPYCIVSKVAREVRHNKMAQLPESTGNSRSLDPLRRANSALY